MVPVVWSWPTPDHQTTTPRSITDAPVNRPPGMIIRSQSRFITRFMPRQLGRCSKVLRTRLIHLSLSVHASLPLARAIHLFAMAPRDRTREFHSTLHSIRQRSNLSVPSAYSLSADPNAQASQRLLPNGAGNDGSHGGGKKGRSALAGTSEFARMAGQIGKDINATTIKLQKLAQCEFQSAASYILRST